MSCCVIPASDSRLITLVSPVGDVTVISGMAGCTPETSFKARSLCTSFKCGGNVRERTAPRRTSPTGGLLAFVSHCSDLYCHFGSVHVVDIVGAGVGGELVAREVIFLSFSYFFLYDCVCIA